MAHRLPCSQACRIFPDQDRTLLPYIGGWTLIHSTTREVQIQTIFFLNLEISVSVIVGPGSLFSAPKPALSSGGPSVVPCNKKDCVDVSVGEMEGCGFTLFFTLSLFEAI